MPKFRGRHNEEVKLPDGRTVWLGRSSAVVASIFAQRGGETYVLVGKRGTGCPDEVGKWGLVCGYVDWDETLLEGCHREAWEETGLDLTDPSAFGAFAYSPRPWFIDDAPASPHQNISHHFWFKVAGAVLPVLAPQVPVTEVEEARWMDIGTVLRSELAFNHQRIVARAWAEMESRL